MLKRKDNLAWERGQFKPERERRGLNKKEMAELCEVTYPFYFQILDGKANPSLQTITRICVNLDVPFQELVSGAAPL